MDLVEKEKENVTMISTHHTRSFCADLSHDHTVKMKKHFLAVRADNQAAGSSQENLEPAKSPFPGGKRKGGTSRGKLNNK